MYLYHRFCGLKKRIMTLLTFIALSISPAHAGGNAAESEACKLGADIIKVAEAIRDPSREGALAEITTLGTDSRYYVLVRGWLKQQIDADRSILSTGSGASREDLANRVAQLERAVRLIDLE